MKISNRVLGLGLALVMASAFSSCGKDDSVKKGCQPTVQVGAIKGQTQEFAVFKAMMKSFSGGGAEDCGHVGKALDPSGVIGCVMNANSSRRGFIAIIQQNDEKSTTAYWEAWVKAEYPSGVVSPTTMIYRQFNDGSYSAQECVQAQPTTGAIGRRPFDCKLQLDQPKELQKMVEAAGC